MKNQSMAKLTKAAGDSRVAMKMKAESAMKMKKESAMKKELVGKQGNLPPELKAKIEAAPAKMRNRKGAMDTEAPLKMKKATGKADKRISDKLDKDKLTKNFGGDKRPGKATGKAADKKGPMTMKEKSAMKKDLPEATVTAKKKQKTGKLEKTLKKGYSKDAQGRVIYRGNLVPSYRLKEAYEITTGGRKVLNPDKRLKIGKEYNVSDKKGGSESPNKMKRKTQVDGEQVTASKASGGMFMKKPTRMTADKGSITIEKKRGNRAVGKNKKTTYSPIGGGKVLAEITKTGKNKTKTKNKVVSEKKAGKKIMRAAKKPQ